jgi:hypothetical protein
LALPKEPRAIVHTGESLIEDFERDAAALFDVLGLIDFAHPPSPKQAPDAIRPERLAKREPRPCLQGLGRRAARRARPHLLVRQPGPRLRCRRQQTHGAQALRCVGERLGAAARTARTIGVVHMCSCLD